MPHPQMFDDDDPLRAVVREHALALPDAAMKVSHGRPAFFTRKVFAYYGGSQRVGGPGRDAVWVTHPWCLMVLPDDVDRAGLLADPRGFGPAYLGPSGWVGVDLCPPEASAPDPAAVDWDEVAELLDASYRRTAPVSLIRRLDPV